MPDAPRRGPPLEGAPAVSEEVDGSPTPRDVCGSRHSLQLADAVGVERRTVQRWERGDRDPGCGELLLIASALSCEVRDLLP
ncbi:helix-turn-helix transcriptional regulator [Streptomyces sp. NRRL F-5630]|uniref:helix-turn-helix transcriptional regulator n=1 Tax=Streptomyces sp. NRRL F-5630 TaxID=1463864 RepID=UPI003D76556D